MTASRTVNRGEIEKLAYEYWLNRGRPEGSADEDWLEAERTLQATARNAKTLGGVMKAAG